MAFEVLKGRQTIYGEKVSHADKEKSQEHAFIHIDHHNNTITLKIQNGPIKEVGVNGCQMEYLAAVLHELIEGHDEINPCRENKIFKSLLEAALAVNDMRTARREKEGTEGTGQGN